jgi:hypothetical protein
VSAEPPGPLATRYRRWLGIKVPDQLTVTCEMSQRLVSLLQVLCIG